MKFVRYFLLQQCSKKVTIGDRHYCKMIVDIDNQNDQTCHKHHIIVTNIFRLQHPSDLEIDFLDLLFLSLKKAMNLRPGLLFIINKLTMYIDSNTL